ncbi:MAG: response regulator [Schwartzia sp.]|nr:response regulator [Schwartzia sp. (in: firmicutes)]
MNKRTIWTGKGALIVMLVFSAALLLAGVMFQDRLGELLIAYTENQTKRQAETLASQAGEKFGTELGNLAYVASKIESSPDELDRLMPMLFNDSGVKQGLLAIDGKPLYGEAIPFSQYSGIQTSFRGKSAITFVRGQGILFTYPVFHGKNIKYVLYRLYPFRAVGERFSIRCYDDIGKVLVATREGDVVVPFADGSLEDIAFMQSGEMKGHYRDLHREMEVSVAAAHSFSTERGKLILFEAEVPDTNYLLAGFVPEEKASEGIENITLLVVWVFGLLLLLVVVAAVYLLRAKNKLEASEALRRAKEVAEDASRAKSEFLSNILHEIRTPINAILGMNEAILRECEDKNILGYSENVRLAGNTLLGLINNILDFSKIEAGKVEILPVEYDLSSMLNDLVNIIRMRAEDKGLAFIPDFDRDTPKRLCGDDLRIKQIITNILTNAVKYTEKGTVTFSVGFERIEEDPDHVLLHVAVKDTGIGIKPEDMGKLFSKFERIEEQRNRNVEGTGLGMTITKNLLDKMGSVLQVESVYGVGSTFSFVLKQKVVKWEPLGDYEASYHDSLRNGKKYRERFTAPEAWILVVDDNPMNLMVFKSILKQTLVEIDTAKDGDEGLVLAQNRKYDVIFLDHMMPKKDGIETLYELRAQKNNPNQATPTICLTANAISGAREEYIAAGFDDYLTKPIDSGKLENMLLTYLPKEKIKEAENGEGEEEPDMELKEGELLEALAPLKGQDWIDPVLGIRNSFSVAAYMPLLKLFYESLDEKADELEGFYTEENIKDYTIKVHALKSSARLIGAEAFGEEAQQLENAGRNGDMEYIRDHHKAFMDKYRSFKAPLAEVFAEKTEDKEGEKPEASADLMKGVYEKIRMAAEDMDCDQLEGIFAEMEEYSIPESEATLYEGLRVATSRFDYEEVLKLLKEKQL